MRPVFLGEIAQRGQHRIGGGIAQAAQRAVANALAQPLEAFHIAGLSLALADAVEDFLHARGAHAAGRAFSAGFLAGKLHEKARHIHHAGGIVHDHQAAEPMMAPVAPMEA